MSVGPQGRAAPAAMIWFSKGGPEGSIATIPRTSPGRASASSHPKGPAWECVTSTAGPIRSSSAAPAAVRALARVLGVQPRLGPGAELPGRRAVALRVGRDGGRLPALVGGVVDGAPARRLVRQGPDLTHF